MTQGGFVMHTLIKADDFPIVFTSVPGPSREQVGCRQGTRDTKLWWPCGPCPLSTISPIGSSLGTSHKLESACFQFGSLSTCTKNFHIGVLGISGICLYQLCKKPTCRVGFPHKDKGCSFRGVRVKDSCLKSISSLCNLFFTFSADSGLQNFS